MAYRFQVNQQTCINCGICMDLCPVRCLDMTRPSGEGEIAGEATRQSPIPGEWAERSWMMLVPVQVASCIGCQVCVQECPTNAITIESGFKKLTYASRGVLSHLPAEDGWQPLDAYTRATAEEPGETPWGQGRAWHVAERRTIWQSWRSWLGERKEDLRAPCQAACPVGTNAGLYVSLIAEGHYNEALSVAAEPNPFPAICGRVCTAPCEDVCRRGEFDEPIAIRDLKRFATDHGMLIRRKVQQPRVTYAERVAIVGAGPTGLSAAYYLARRGYSVTIIDAMPVAGGMMANCLRMKLEAPDAQGRRRPVPIPGSDIEIVASTVLIAIGEAPDPSFLPFGTSVQVAPWGGLLINKETLATPAPGVFAAGDVTYGPRSIIHAAAHGRKAAQCIHAYLRKRSPKDMMEMPDDQFETASTLPRDGKITLNLSPTVRQEMPLRTASEAARDRSVEFVLGFTEEQARREASRCLRCDLAYLCPTVKVITPASVVKVRS